MKSKQIRRQFIEFFEKKGHKHFRSSSVAPHDDPTLLFTNAGMNQFKPIFLGDKNPDYIRVANSQKCIRVSGKHNDLEEVGVDDYHHTFFEMLGNWSFGDYYKKEAIEWAWELLTDVWKLDKKRIWVTIFKDDDETGEIWKKNTDISSDRILKFGHKDNFWEMGDIGPCGPCTEIHYFTGNNIDVQNADGVNVLPEYREIWNLVFIQFNRDKNGKLHDLPNKHVDTGMGLERVVSILNGKSSNYDTDLFQPIIDKITELSGKKYSYKKGVPHRVLSDHIRMLSFSIADGAMPGNEGRGYVLRRVLRRASRYGRTLGMNEPFLSKLVPVLIDIMGNSFTEIREKQLHIERVIFSEEKSFLNTLDKGLNIFDKIINNNLLDGKITGEDVFKLYDTYGFPVDLTALMAKEKGIGININDFQELMEQQKNRARQSGKFRAIINKANWTLIDQGNSNEFMGYSKTRTNSKIRKFRKIDDCHYEIVLNQTPFYAEQGGQVGDTGTINSENFSFDVIDTKNDSGDIIHFGKIKNGDIELQVDVLAIIDTKRRQKIRLNHTATHLLHKALKIVLGEHVHQAGSLVEDKRLRFDFTHSEKLKNEEIFEIEKIVNKIIRKNSLIQTNVMDFDSAKKTGAVSMFGEKYGDTVRVVVIDDFSNEFCGGTHAERTGDIGLFKIISESSLASGVRRIEAITSSESINWINRRDNTIQKIQKAMNCSFEDINIRVESLIKNKIDLEKKITKHNLIGNNNISDDILKKVEEINGCKLVIDQIKFSGNILDLGDQIRSKLKNGVAIIGIVNNDRPVVLCAVTDSLVSLFNAGNLVGKIGKKMNGGGGGKPHLAQAGGKDVSLLPDVLKFGKELIINRLKNEKN